MGFISKNESFTCEHCGREVPKAARSCRNHCPRCLYSKHVDEFTPGDRASICQGMMRPIDLAKTGRDYIITHKCERCGKMMRNKAAPDDALERLI